MRLLRWRGGGRRGRDLFVIGVVGRVREDFGIPWGMLLVTRL